MDTQENTFLLPKGYNAIGFRGRIKKEKLDMAILSSNTPAAAAGVFTKNAVRASCVDRNQMLLKKGSAIKCILVNSGNANACTGSRGEKDNKNLASHLADTMNIEESSILTASTGIIGVNLPLDDMYKAITEAALLLVPTKVGLESAARAILTTDTNIKQYSITINLDGYDVTISGIAKGSGMIHPNMATMFGFIMTDANISQNLLQKALTRAVDYSFNMISIDGDTSTNDMAVLLANGEAGNNKILENSNNYKLFFDSILSISKSLAKSIVRDGEGATKLIEVEVNGCKNKTDAKKLAKSVICSALVKTAIFGGDANWGRIIVAMGYSEVDFDHKTVSIYFRGTDEYICVMHNGVPCNFDKKLAAAILKQKDIYIIINMKDGKFSATAWGCDLSYDYIKINSAYYT